MLLSLLCRLMRADRQITRFTVLQWLLGSFSRHATFRDNGCSKAKDLVYDPETDYRWVLYADFDHTRGHCCTAETSMHMHRNLDNHMHTQTIQACTPV